MHVHITLGQCSTGVIFEVLDIDERERESVCVWWGGGGGVRSEGTGLSIL